MENKNEQTPKGKFGTPVNKLGDPELKKRIKDHLGEEYSKWTPGQIQSSVDGPYGQPDPRSMAGEKAWGDFTATGGSGPKKKK